MFTEDELLALIECIDGYDIRLVNAKDILIKIKDMGKQLNSLIVVAEANSAIEDCY